MGCLTPARQGAGAAPGAAAHGVLGRRL